MSRRSSTLYVGGLEDSVTEDIIHAAFIPFGDLRAVQIPKDYAQNKNRGFAFVEYESAEDCADALENMDGSELMGRVLRCNIAKPLSKIAPGKSLWSAEDWIQNSLSDTGVPLNVDDDDDPTSFAPMSLAPSQK